MLVAALLAAQLLGARFHYKDRIAAGHDGLFAAALVAAMVAVIWFSPAQTAQFIYFRF